MARVDVPNFSIYIDSGIFPNEPNEKQN